MTAQVGLTVVHRRYVPHSHAHYGGDLVDGAYVLGLFGDAATELCIRSDGDEGLFAGYDSVEFTAPVQAGDVIWMSAFCPQWFIAGGKSPSRYIYYKNVNRAPNLVRT